MKASAFALLISISLVGPTVADNPTRYLAFQIFTSAFDANEMRQANIPPNKEWRKSILDLRDKIGAPAAEGRRIGFVLGPISLDDTDEQVRELIADGFALAQQTGMAVGLHIDDSIFWGLRKELNTSDNIEWLDWKGTSNTGRRLDWSSKPSKIMPQLCLNSIGVRKAVSDRARLIGVEIAKGIAKLHAARQDDLFLGVIAGWETQIGRDFATGQYLGYHALTNAGFSATHLPADIDVARCNVVHEFIGFWSQSLIDAGVPKGKVYSHIAFMSEALHNLAQRDKAPKMAATYLQRINFTPPSTAFCDSCIAGFSTYPQPGHLEQWQSELKKHGDPPWASCEGTAIDPAQAERGGPGMSVEGYLGNLFNHGAVLVNVFGWGVGQKDNPFRKIAEGETSFAAYKKFIRGEKLDESPIPAPPPAGLQEKVRKLQSTLPQWIQKNGPALVKDDVAKLEKALKEHRFADAEKAADAILKTIGNEPNSKGP